MQPRQRQNQGGMEFFENIGKVRYEGKNATSPFAFRCYNPDEVIGGKTMREQLRFAMSYWHTMCAEGTDMVGTGTISKQYGSATLAEPEQYALSMGDVTTNISGRQEYLEHVMNQIMFDI